jgi:hypothetical protein
MFNKIARWANFAIMPLSAIFIVLLLFAGGNLLGAVTWFFIGLSAYFNNMSFKILDERE